MARVPGLSSIVMERGVAAQMPDGRTLYADVYRPASGGPFPVILMRLPYDKTTAQNATYQHPAWYAQHGYMVVVQDVRGRGPSEGEFYPFANEAEDGYHSVEWAGGLPYSNGRVGMYGFSYVGATQLQAALRRPPSLRTICPGFTGSQYYEGWAYNGGAFALAFDASWATQLAAAGARRAGDDVATRELNEAFINAPDWYRYLPLSAYPPLASTPYGHFFFDWLAHPSYDDYWRHWSVDEDYSRIDVPALHLGGWYDIFIAGTIKNFLGLRQGAGSDRARRAQKLLVGPWYHLPWTSLTGEVNFGPEAMNVVNQWQMRWFNQFLKEEDTGVLEAPVTVFLTGANRWLNVDSWPPAGTDFRDYYLRSAGGANSLNGNGALTPEPAEHEPPDIYTYDPLSPVPSAGGRSCCFPIVAPMGPADQAGVEMLNAVLLYTTPPLERDVAVAGPVTATLFAATTAQDTDFVAKLCDVSPEGISINLAGGIIRARYRTSLSAPRLVNPGEVYEYRIDLGPAAHLFRAGHRIRLQVTSSDFPQWDRNLNTGGALGTEGAAAAQVATQFVLHEREYPSRLTLPVVEV